MPNGRSRPSAKTELADGESAPSGALKTRTRLDRVSAMKMSPLGATWTMRGPARSVAKGFTVNPGGTDSWAFAGRAASFGLFPADVVAYGFARLAKVTECFTPGASWRQSRASEAPGPVEG